MKLSKCLSCEKHVLYERGYVICNFYKVEEQRMTEKKDEDVIYIVNCPKEVEKRR